MTDTALLVIDVQQSFEHCDFWSDADLPLFQDRQNALIGAARDRGWHVVFVLHNSRGAFAADSGYVTAMNFVDQRDDDPVFNKRVHNALSDSGLHDWLQQNDVTKLLISGIRTEQCCETTARVASDFGYRVEFVLDATLTFDMQHPVSGETVDAAAIKSHTALALARRFATIGSVADYLR